MKDDLQRRVQRYGWDRAAPHYESVWRRPLEPSQEKLLERAALRPGMDVIDVACGTGMVTFPAAEAVAPGGTVVATDLSRGMVDQARRTADKRSISNVSFERTDAQDLMHAEETFDAALCALGLMYVPEPVEALREMHRVLVPGGRAVAIVWGTRENCGWAEVFPIVDRRVQSEVCPLFFQLGSGDALEATFRTAGFTSVTADRFGVDLLFGSEEEACGAVFEGGPVAMAWRTFDEEMRERARTEYLETIASYRRGDSYLIPGEFVVAEGVSVKPH